MKSTNNVSRNTPFLTPICFECLEQEIHKLKVAQKNRGLTFVEEVRLSELIETRKTAHTVIPTSFYDDVAAGSRVNLKRIDDDKIVIIDVCGTETFSHRLGEIIRVSRDCGFGRALMGKKRGDVVRPQDVNSPVSPTKILGEMGAKIVWIGEQTRVAM